MKILILFLICCVSLCSCKGPKNKPIKGEDYYGSTKREIQRKAQQKWERRQCFIKAEKEAKMKRHLECIDSTQKLKQTSKIGTALTLDNVYQMGYGDGFQQGFNDAEEGLSHGDGYDDSNNFDSYYHTKYCEGYEEGYEDGYQNGE